MTAFDPQETPTDPQPEPREPREGDPGVAPSPIVPPAGPHEAKAGSYYRNVRYVITLALIGMGCWFLYDGFVKYPEENRLFEELTQQAEEADMVGDEATRVAAQERIQDEGLEPHSETDIMLQRGLGMLLPPLGLVLLVRWLYISRGRIYLDENDVLEMPGHPAVSPGNITEIDDGNWDRKGISRIVYDVEGTTGTAKLDDFVYDRKPVDAIHDRLVYLKSDTGA